MGEERCAARVYGGTMHGHPCTRKGVNVEDGKLWCKQHTPSVAKAKRDARHKEWERKWNAERTEVQRQQDEIAALFALREAVGKYLTDDSGADIDELQAAYAKCEATNDGK